MVGKVHGFRPAHSISLGVLGVLGGKNRHPKLEGYKPAR